VQEFLEASKAANTNRAYANDLRQFVRWGGLLPTAPEMLAGYLASQARLLKVASLSRRLASISAWYRARGIADPTKTDLVRLTFKGIRRKCGEPQRQVAALSLEDLATISSHLGSSAVDQRDKALLLVGFAGAFRRSELAQMRREHLRFSEDGVTINIPRSKTDQNAMGRQVVIPRGEGALCAVAALEAWLRDTRLLAGPVFSAVQKRCPWLGLSGTAIASTVKRRVSEIGLNPRQYSGHSLRAGFVTAAVTRGFAIHEIKHWTGHRTDASLARYIRQEGRLRAPSLK
jgi:integrase